MQPINFVLIVLAVFRLTFLIVYEDGPLDMFAYFRGFILDTFGEESWLWRGVNCPYCVSFWFSLFALFVWFHPLSWLGTAGATMLLFKAIELKEV